MPKYCVIGAGAAGVSATHQLRAAGFDVDCFEKTSRVGGHWHTDYDALHLITSRDMTAFEDFPMPADYTTSSSSTPPCIPSSRSTPMRRWGRGGGW